MILTNAGGLWYAKGVQQEFDGVRNLVSINPHTDIRIERSGNQGDTEVMGTRDTGGRVGGVKKKGKSPG